jgi:WhiB family redox-sensing transcriptional regulator
MKRLYGIPIRGMKRSKEMAEISRLPIPVMEEWEWQYQGACRDLDPEMFFHPDGERGPRRRNRENAAKAVCASCPVIAACRAHALAVQEPYGIWGGLSEDDRTAILERQGVTPLTIPASIVAETTVSHAS